jgi:hypothetical protein
VGQAEEEDADDERRVAHLDRERREQRDEDGGDGDGGDRGPDDRGRQVAFECRREALGDRHLRWSRRPATCR